MNVYVISVIFFLTLLNSCNGRKQKVRYGSEDLRGYLFGSLNVTSVYLHSGSLPNSYIINDPPAPIPHDKHIYYWDGFYQKGADTERVCRFQITDADGELFEVKFTNGTSPKALLFECGRWEECCGAKCCNHIFGFLVTMGCFAMLFLVVFCAFCLS